MKRKSGYWARGKGMSESVMLHFTLRKSVG